MQGQMTTCKFFLKTLTYNSSNVCSENTIQKIQMRICHSWMAEELLVFLNVLVRGQNHLGNVMWLQKLMTNSDAGSQTFKSSRLKIPLPPGSDQIFVWYGINVWNKLPSMSYSVTHFYPVHFLLVVVLKNHGMLLFVDILYGRNKVLNAE